MEAAVASIAVGVRQCDAAAAISQAQITGVDGIGGDYPAIVPMLPTGEAADTPHLTWSEDRFQAGQAVVVELAGAYHRYHAPAGPHGGARHAVAPARRNWPTPSPTGWTPCSTEIQPGVPVSELARTWNRTLAKYGLEKPSRIGYSIGIGYPPDWGERTISIRSEDETILAENMTFHLIGGMWMDGYGYELSESIRVSADGVETLHQLPAGTAPERQLTDDRELLRRPLPAGAFRRWRRADTSAGRPCRRTGRLRDRFQHLAAGLPDT